MELDDFTVLIDVGGYILHLPFQVGGIFSGMPAVLCDDGVAAAVKTEGEAERDVEIQREWGEVFPTIGLYDLGLKPFGTEGLIPDRGRGVACISWSRSVIFEEGVNANHLLSSCTISTRAFAWSTGVSGSIPCPRLKIWPGPRPCLPSMDFTCLLITEGSA